MSRFTQFIELLRSHGRRSCIEGDGFSYTYAQVLAETDRWRLRFDELNVAPGSIIGMRADYSFSAVAALLALMARGALVALIPRNQAVARYLVDAHATALLEFDAEGTYQWSHVSNPASHPLIERLREAGESGVIIFTSGSTGRPKAALQSVERFLHKFLNARRRFRTLAFLLFDHVAGLDTLFYTLASGGTLILTRHRDPESVLKLIESHKVEVLPASPSFLRLLCAAKNDSKRDLSSLKVITYGSEPMDASTLARLNTRFANLQISQKYGTTETGSPRSVSRSNDSLWIKLSGNGVETKVVDEILWIRSEGTTLGYLNAASPLDEDGWYCTGDLVDVDGEWIRFRGRLTDIIKVGGEKVAPAEVEQVILELDFVRDVVVSGEPHPLMGEVVAARAVLTTAAIDLKEAAKRIRSRCRQRLALYKVPVRVEITTEDLTNDRQKTLRRHTKPM